MLNFFLKKFRIFFRTNHPEDFSCYLPPRPESPKEKLILECQRRGVPIFKDDSSETSAGVYAHLRAVSSEAELQSRLISSLSLEKAKWANRIAWLALVVGFLGLIVACVK